MRVLLWQILMFLVSISLGCSDDTSGRHSNENNQVEYDGSNQDVNESKVDTDGIKQAGENVYVRESDGARVDLENLVYYGLDGLYSEGTTTEELVCNLHTLERYRLGVIYVTNVTINQDDLGSDCSLGEDVMKRPHYRYEAITIGNVFGMPAVGTKISLFRDITGGLIQPRIGDILFVSILNLRNELRLGPSYYLAPPLEWHNRYDFPVSDLIQLPSDITRIEEHLESLQCPEPNKLTFEQMEEYYFGGDSECKL